MPASVGLSVIRIRAIQIVTRSLGVSCGIPDFRSKNGLYAQLQEKGEYDLDDPQQMYVTARVQSGTGILMAYEGLTYTISERSHLVCSKILA